MVAVYLRRVADSASHSVTLAEEEIAAVATIARTQAGPAYLWDDDFTTTIKIGGGLNQGLITIGSAITTVRLNESIDVTQAKISRNGALAVRAVGVGNTLTLSGHGTSIPLNDVANIQPSAELLKTSLVGLVNELLTRPTTGVSTTYTNTTGGLLAKGTVVCIAAQNAVKAASPASDNADSFAIGVLEEDTADTVDGAVISSGLVDVLFAAGEGASPAANSPVFLSTTAGLGTLTPPSATGQVVVLIGYVKNSTGYSNVSGGTMSVQLKLGSRRVLP